MHVVLTVISGPRAGVRMRFPDKDAVTIGRSKTTDFHVLDGTMSRVHAVVGFDGSGWYLEDQKSRNGTWVEEERVQRVPIESGSVFFLGKETSIRFEVEEDPDTLRASSANFSVVPPCAACGEPIDRPTELVRSPDGRPYHLPCRNLDYLIGSELGEFRVVEKTEPIGGAFFFRARQPSLNRTVLLEVFDLPLTSRPGFRQALLDEVRQASRLVHPNLLQIYAFDEARGMSFVVMEDFQGERLPQVLEQRRAVKIRGSIQIAMGVVEALIYARREGVDTDWICTDPILVSGDHNVKVKLFEEPSAEGGHSPNLLQARYVAPERLEAGAPVPGESVLVWSVAAMLYHMLAGIPPFEGETLEVLLRRMQRENPPALRRINLKVSPPLATLVESSLECNPSSRPKTLGAFLERLQEIAGVR